MKKSRIISLLLAAAMLFSLACLSACGDSGDAAPADSASGAALAEKAKDISTEEVKIAYIPLSASGDTVTMTLEGFNYAIAGYPNVSIQVFDPQFDVTKEIEYMNECITQGFDAIIVQSADTTALNQTITEAEEAGITVLTQNTGCAGIRTVHVTNSDYNSGYQAAQYLKDNGVLPSGANVVILDVIADIKPNCRMGTGFHDYVTANTDWNILAEEPIENTSQENANTVMRDLLTKFDDIDCVYAVNDDCAMGAIQAIEAAGLSTDDIVVWGYEGHPAALQAIIDGRLYGTSYADLFTSSYSIMMLALYCVETGFTGTQSGFEYYPSLEFSTVPCTRDNWQDILAYTHWDLDF